MKMTALLTAFLCSSS